MSYIQEEQTEERTLSPDYKTWSNTDVVYWLKTKLNLRKYYRNFVELAVDGDMLDFITEEDLQKDLNVDIRIHRAKIMQHIHILRRQNSCQMDKNMRDSTIKDDTDFRGEMQVCLPAQKSNADRPTAIQSDMNLAMETQADCDQSRTIPIACLIVEFSQADNDVINNL